MGIRISTVPRVALAIVTALAMASAATALKKRTQEGFPLTFDQATIDPSAGQLVRASLGRLEAALTGVVSECWADAKGLPASAENASRQARHLTSVYFGLRVLTRAGTVPETLDDAKRAALQMLVDA